MIHKGSDWLWHEPMARMEFEIGQHWLAEIPRLGLLKVKGPARTRLTCKIVC